MKLKSANPGISHSSAWWSWEGPGSSLTHTEQNCANSGPDQYQIPFPFSLGEVMTFAQRNAKYIVTCCKPPSHYHHSRGEHSHWFPEVLYSWGKPQNVPGINLELWHNGLVELQPCIARGAPDRWHVFSGENGRPSGVIRADWLTDISDGRCVRQNSSETEREKEKDRKGLPGDRARVRECIPNSRATVGLPSSLAIRGDGLATFSPCSFICERFMTSYPLNACTCRSGPSNALAGWMKPSWTCRCLKRAKAGTMHASDLWKRAGLWRKLIMNETISPVTSNHHDDDISSFQTSLWGQGSTKCDSTQ